MLYTGDVVQCIIITEPVFRSLKHTHIHRENEPTKTINSLPTSLQLLKNTTMTVIHEGVKMHLMNYFNKI